MKKTILLILTALLCLTATAQRIEARFDKDFSTDSLLNKTLGGGASFIIDGWHPNLDFQINVDYVGHRGKADYNYMDWTAYKVGVSQRINKVKAGVSALYTRPLGQYFHLRVGGDVSYNNIKKVVTNYMDTLAPNNNGITSTTYRAHLLGIGAIVQVQAQLGKMFRLGVGITPTYLIPLSQKVSVPDKEPCFNKGIFDFQLHIGLEIRLNNDN